MKMMLQAKRRLVQVVSLVLLNLNLWAFSLERYCVPVMNCEGCVFAWLGCPVGMMGRSLAFLEFPWLLIGTLLVFSILVGRFFCGWICPVGLLQDLLDKIPLPKFQLPRWTAGIKYVILLVTVIAVPLYFGYKGTQGLADDEWPDVVDEWAEDEWGDAAWATDPDTEEATTEVETTEDGTCDFAAPDGAHAEDSYTDSPWFFCSFCPTASMQVVIPAMIEARGDYHQPWGFRFSVLALVLIAATMNSRIFCKVMCPVGAMIALGNRLSFFKIKVNPSTCITCKKCNRHCPMDINVMETREGKHPVSRDTECIACLSCESVCPAHAVTNNSRLLHKDTVAGKN